MPSTLHWIIVGVGVFLAFMIVFFAWLLKSTSQKRMHRHVDGGAELLGDDVARRAAEALLRLHRARWSMT